MLGTLLIWIEAFFYEDHSKAEDTYSKLKSTYPNAVMMHYLAGYVSRSQGNISEAISRFELGKECSLEMSEMRNIVIYEIGWCYYLQNNYREAVERFQLFLSAHMSKTYKSWCYYQLGYCYANLGMKAEAMEAMALVKEFKRKHYSWDEYASRKAGEFIGMEGELPKV